MVNVKRTGVVVEKEHTLKKGSWHGVPQLYIHLLRNKSQHIHQAY